MAVAGEAADMTDTDVVGEAAAADMADTGVVGIAVNN